MITAGWNVIRAELLVWNVCNIFMKRRFTADDLESSANFTVISPASLLTVFFSFLSVLIIRFWYDLFLHQWIYYLYLPVLTSQGKFFFNVIKKAANRNLRMEECRKIALWRSDIQRHSSVGTQLQWKGDHNSRGQSPDSSAGACLVQIALL